MLEPFLIWISFSMSALALPNRKGDARKSTSVAAFQTFLPL
jgi:hypothetical protein